MSIKAKVWIEAGNFFLRDSAQGTCWLWVLENSGQVHAMRVLACDIHKDEKIPAWLAHIKNHPDTPLHNHPELGWLWYLPDAPVVPNFRWSVSWGRPLRREIDAFAAQLNQAVLCTLGELETHELFFSSIENYNDFISLSAMQREKRLQALAIFPPLLMPLMLKGLRQPELFGATDENDWRRDDTPQFHKRNDKAGQQVLSAIDNNQNLVKVLAKYWNIQRSVLQCQWARERWPHGEIPHFLLRLANALPQQKRPVTQEDLLTKQPYLEMLPIQAKYPNDIKRLATMWRVPWDEFWQHRQQQNDNLATQIRNSKDFIAAAHSEVLVNIAPQWLTPEDVALGWLAHLGLQSLLNASERWHNQPLQQEAPKDNVQLEPVLAGFTHELGSIKELLSASDFYQEGQAMHHCVADYWPNGLTHAERFVHLCLQNDTCATAQYKIDTLSAEQEFYQVELLGANNAEPSEAMQQFSASVLAYLNQEKYQPLREHFVIQAQARSQAYNSQARQSYRVLDRRSRDECLKVLAYCLRQSDWQSRQNYLYAGAVVGTFYTQGLTVQHSLKEGEKLTLKRELNNTYDSNAVAVYWQNTKLGYLPRSHNQKIAERLDRRTPLSACFCAPPSTDSYNPYHCVVMFKQCS